MAYNWKSEYHRYQRYFVNLSSLYQKREAIVYTGITLSLFAIAFFTFFALKPTATIIVSLISEIREKKTISDQLQTKINALSMAQTFYASNQDLINLVNESLPENPNYAQIIKYFEKTFEKQSVTLRDISYDPYYHPGDNVSSKTISFNFTIQGEYKNLKNVLNQIENCRRIIVVESFTLGTAGLENPEILGLNVIGKIFYYSNNPENQQT